MSISAKETPFAEKCIPKNRSNFKIMDQNFDILFIVSDHGFNYYRKRISINKLLYVNELIEQLKQSRKNA